VEIPGKQRVPALCSFNPTEVHPAASEGRIFYSFMTNTYDIIIIGAGPAGLSTAIEAKKAGLSHLIIEKGNIVNGIQRYQRKMYFVSTPELLEIGGIPFVVPTTRPTSLD